MTSGILVVDKPSGPTSHDMVARARRALGEARIGHTGTLDPMATGVLALAVGQATRLVQFLAADQKHYAARVRFGRTTDTYDATGTMVTESVARPSRAALDEALRAFGGTLLQTPPAYSAKKVDGVRAYALARAAVPVLPAAVTVTVHSLALDGFDGELADLRLVVSAGFYVRSLAHDLGTALGCGAVLEGLRRTQAGVFTLEAAVTAEDLFSQPREALATRLRPLNGLLPELPAAALTAADVVRVRHGQDVVAGLVGRADGTDGAGMALPPLVRLVDPDGQLVALATPGKAPGSLHPAVVLG